MLEDPENSAWSDVSVEFCGGTHLSNTQEAGTFVILEEVIQQYGALPCCRRVPLRAETALSVTVKSRALVCQIWNVPRGVDVPRIDGTKEKNAGIIRCSCQIDMDLPVLQRVRHEAVI